MSSSTHACARFLRFGGSRTNKYCNAYNHTSAHTCVVANSNTNTCAYVKANAETYSSTTADLASTYISTSYPGLAAFVYEYRRASRLSEKREVCLFRTRTFQVEQPE